MKKSGTILFRIAVSIAMALFLVLSPGWLIEKNGVDHYRAFYEKPAPAWYGIVDLWHVVGFRTYQGSVTDFLAAQAEKYNAHHPGVHVRVTDMSVAYYREQAERGTHPDGYSFPAGLLYLEQLQPLALDPPTYKSNLQNAAAGGEIYAAPFFLSAYVFLTNTQLFPETGGAFDPLGGGTDGVDPALLQGALSDDAAKSQLTIPPLLAANANLTGESAPYERFSKGKAGYAVADLRALGEISRRTKDNLPLSAAPYADVSDLVQFLGIARDADAKRAAVLADFFAFLLSEAEQALLPTLGAFPVIQNVPDAMFSEEILKKCYEKIEETRFPDAFLLQQQQDALQSDAANALAGQAGADASFRKRMAVVFGG